MNTIRLRVALGVAFLSAVGSLISLVGLAGALPAGASAAIQSALPATAPAASASLGGINPVMTFTVVAIPGVMLCAWIIQIALS